MIYAPYLITYRPSRLRRRRALKWIRMLRVIPFRLIPFLILGALAFLLLGCSSSSETFDCEPGKGVGCQPIHGVNDQVNEGRLGQEERAGSPSRHPFSPADPLILSNGFMVVGTPAQYKRLWVAPYEDGEGNFHDAQVIYTAFKPSSWKLVR